MRNVLSSVVLASLVGCATTTGSPCGAGAHRAIQELLYFGAETPLGYVTPDNSAQFLNETVTPRFPEWLSVWQASGQWRSVSGKVIREPSYILNLVHLDDPVIFPRFGGHQVTR